MKVLITGSAGFIGFHISKKFLENKFEVIGIDNFDNYYDVNLKKKRNKILLGFKKFKFYKKDIVKLNEIKKIFDNNKIDLVIHLAAQAGVRHSLENPKKYIDTNLVGFFNLISLSKDKKIKHFTYASTSSVYGDSKKFPLKEKNNTDNPLSLYAATKKSNELIAHSYSANYNLPTTGLRFFTVFGPYGRPDMALFKFTKNILNNKFLDLFNHGKHQRDFTYIDDVVESLYKIVFKIPKKTIPFEIFNISSNNPHKLKYFLKIIEKKLGKKSKINKLGLQIGDVYKTHGSNSKLIKKIKYKPKNDIVDGINKFINWYKDFYK